MSTIRLGWPSGQDIISKGLRAGPALSVALGEKPLILKNNKTWHINFLMAGTQFWEARPSRLKFHYINLTSVITKLEKIKIKIEIYILTIT